MSSKSDKVDGATTAATAVSATTNATSAAVEPAPSPTASPGINSKTARVLKYRCFRYGIQPGLYQATEWSQNNKDMGAAEIVVSSHEGQCRIRVTDTKSALSFSDTAKGNVLRVTDSTRFYVMVLGGKKIGVGFFKREESQEFIDFIMRELGITEIPIFEPPPPPTPPTPPSQTPPVTVDTLTDTSRTPVSEVSLENSLGSLTIRHNHPPEQPDMSSSVPDETPIVADRAEAEAKVDALVDSIDTTQEVTGPRRKHEEEDTTHPKWHSHRKHVFVLSDNGKPIYTRYGDELRLVPFFGSLMGFVSFVESFQDQLRYFTAGDQLYVFTKKGPLIYVIISKTGEGVPVLLVHLEYVHSQIVAILTFAGIKKLFAKRNTADLRGLLPDRNRHLDKLIHEINNDPAFVLKAMRPMPLHRDFRSKINQAMANRPQDLLFGILFCDYQLITLVRPKKYPLHPMDLHIAMNLVNSNASFRENESWIPICLPLFDDKGCLYAYVCYLVDNVCLMLLTTIKESFYVLKEYKTKVQSDMEANGTLSMLKERCCNPHYNIRETKIPSLLHFMYMYKSQSVLGCFQLTTPTILDPPYNTTKEKKRLFRLYSSIRERCETDTQPHKMYISSTEKETVVVWVTSEFELYATVGPLEQKQAITKVSQLQQSN
ncbi:DUF254 family protein [Pelomyxa schiedti]|nr:DUF254 family protein [Pelomyxa schiedti]